MAIKILDSVKNILGIEVTDTDFDAELKLYSNTVLASMNQMGIGPEEVFAISTGNETWDEFTSDQLIKSMAPDYLGLRVKLMFDPPSNSYLVDNIKKAADEWEWRMHLQANPIPASKEQSEED